MPAMGGTSLLLGPDREGRVLLLTDDQIAHFGGSEATSVSSDIEYPCPSSRIHPGQVNAHTHIYSGLVPLGMPPPEHEPENFVQILERIWWRLDRALDEASMRASAHLYVAEALLAGTTSLIDHHESPNFIEGSLDILADVCQELGVRALLCFGATERNGGRQEARQGLAECRRFIESNRRSLVRGVVGLHASFTVSDDTIRDAGALCRELDTVMHVHMAEDEADVRDAQERGFPGPLERLLELQALPAGSILAHGIHLAPEQVKLVAEHKIWLVQNPRSNRGNRVGYPSALRKSGRVALGTDGYPARMRDEATALREEAAAHHDDAAAAERRLKAGHDLVSELFGSTFSPLQPGGAADAVASEDGSARHVVVGGRLVVEDGRLLTGDLEQIQAAAEAEAPRLWRRMAALP